MSGVDCLLWHVCIREEDRVLGQRATEQCLVDRWYVRHVVPPRCPCRLRGSVATRAGGFPTLALWC